MLTTLELKQAQSDFAAAFLTSSARILRLKQPAPQSKIGGTIESRSPFGKPVPCRVDIVRRQSEVQTAGETQAQSDYTISLPVGTNLLATDRLEVGGIIYDVLGTDAGRTDALCLLANVTKIGQA